MSGDQTAPSTATMGVGKVNTVISSRRPIPVVVGRLLLASAIVLCQSVLPWAHAAIDHGPAPAHETAVAEAPLESGGHHDAADCRVCEMVRNAGPQTGLHLTVAARHTPCAYVAIPHGLFTVSLTGLTTAPPRGPPSLG